MKAKIKISVGTEVQWKWMGHFVAGEVKEVYFEPVSKTIKGKIIKRIGSKENPAYLVQSKAGNLALKLQSELQIYKVVTAKIGKSKISKPKMFS